MITPRRYVRVNLYGYDCSICGRRLGTRYNTLGANATEADRHARTCPAVAAAMERDQLRAELDALRVKYAAASQARDAWRRLANRNRAEADRMRVDRDRLRDRLHQTNPFSKDNDR